MIARAAVLFFLIAASAAAEAPSSSLRPVARGGDVDRIVSAVVSAAAAPASAQPVRAFNNVTSRAPVRSLRPAARQSASRTVNAAVEVAVAEAARSAPVAPAPTVSRTVPVSSEAVARSLRPAMRTAAVLNAGRTWAEARARGQVCGDPDLQGEPVGFVDGQGACGIEDAVRLRSVLGVRLSQSATIDCRTAQALKTWVAGGVMPALRREGASLASLRVAAHYACRGRNNQRNARLSEHAFGRAIDISGFTLADGSTVTVQDGWGSRAYGDALRRMRADACGPFTTVLGPGSDRYHSDHFHLDTARGRGTYCR